MPFAQGLIAATHVHIPLKRAFILLALFAVGLGPALTQSTLAVAIAFSSASVLSAVWLVHKAMHILRLERSVLQTVRAPMIAASVMMIQSVLLLPHLATADPLLALMSLALTGVGVGLVAALALTRVLQSLLFAVTAQDPLTFAALSGVLVGVAALACFWRETRPLNWPTFRASWSLAFH